MKLRCAIGADWAAVRGSPPARRSVVAPASRDLGPWKRGACTSEDMLDESTGCLFCCFGLSAARQKQAVKGRIKVRRDKGNPPTRHTAPACSIMLGLGKVKGPSLTFINASHNRYG